MNALESRTSRRALLRQAGWALTAAACAAGRTARAQAPGDRPRRDEPVQVQLPLGRVPVSLIIDDSTCLVNLNRFAMPQFAEALPESPHYRRDWRRWPVEIPDDFVRKFAHWCGEQGVRGKYSVVPFPACVGRLDRGLPGWTTRELSDSLHLVRSLLLPNWDIHPEMVTHTRVIDLRTGHPLPEISRRTFENWDWTAGRSADELADYFRYALEILKNVGLPCEGVTTPGGFGNQVLPALAQATLAACRDVFQAEVPHYFRHLYDQGAQSVAPRVELATGLAGPDPRCVVSIIGCTGDWTGGWDCSDRGHTDRFLTPDLRGGRLVEVIERGEPAVLVCHWTGIYFNGDEVGFQVFQEVVRRLHARFDNLLWMKISELARYWAAKELTQIAWRPGQAHLAAPFGTSRFTVSLPAAQGQAPRLTAAGQQVALREVARPLELAPGCWVRQGDRVTLAFDLPKGESTVDL
jgi:hypothetical protein